MRDFKLETERNKKISESLTGRICSQEHRDNIGKSQIGSSKAAKDYLVTFPDGHEETVHNLKKFCEEHNLKYYNLNFVVQGRTKQHQRYKARKVE